MVVYFINVGCGNMTLILMPNGTTFVIDCNITEENKDSVFKLMKTAMESRTKIDVFVNTHRDADHMRGLKLLHAKYPIGKVWDSGIPGTTTDSKEYKEYMELRRNIGYKEIEARTYWTYGDVKIRCMNSKWTDYSNANTQSIVIKAEFKTKSCSAIITGDTDFKPWKEKILPHYNEKTLQCAILQAAHHGSITFFDDPSDEKNYYINHIKKLNPRMTIISVGPNSYGLPDKKATELYEKYSAGSNKGNKVYTTEEQGNMKVVFSEDGGWTLYKGL